MNRALKKCITYSPYYCTYCSRTLVHRCVNIVRSFHNIAIVLFTWLFEFSHFLSCCFPYLHILMRFSRVRFFFLNKQRVYLRENLIIIFFMMKWENRNRISMGYLHKAMHWTKHQNQLIIYVRFAIFMFVSICVVAFNATCYQCSNCQHTAWHFH